MKISFHTDAFNSAVFSFEKALQWAQSNDVHHIECGVIEGVSWIHGLGYFPHISLCEDPLALRRKMEGYGVAFSQIDAAYPLSGRDGPYLGVPYVLKTIPWAKLAGCPNIATTDGLYRPEGLSDQQAMEVMKRSYGAILEVAEALRDQHQHRDPRLLHHQAGHAREDARLLEEQVLRGELRHRELLHLRSGSRWLF